MALGMKYNTRSGGQELKKGFVQKTSILGRKRVVVLSSLVEDSGFASPVSTKLQKRRCRRSPMEGLNHLEALPKDILIRILCKVGHSDLRQLFQVSKAVQEATLIAKELHFAFSTPLKSMNRGGSDLEQGIETPNAPKQHRIAKSRIDGKKLASIAVALFTSPLED
ncbi:hypothetical protein J5N97_027157 [Dioscorea zingiberensis]|uniref:F-box domain-containing protein n=1 Tax=Dioscorea zingiberensis TaxID=325984 RepID=A0A9D5H7C8_9LILI|nr:hypothetical protein J5N97_027157 [Dioscorea zingiberensis]